ncbi:uncharacterized protein LOC116212324 [Punica granatum]|uniref:Uncharacterized protein LOC116212324 n=1 Tax=Punica granatum TaxID=22663 RepID=A0A6P8E5K3_PUNGR|nr:uncharacterized protein LOC116212324 [Punica granatum]
MRVLCWNCRGAGSSRFVRVMKEMIRDHRPNIVVIVEPRISGAKADAVCRKFSDYSVERVEAQGFSGGIWVWWQPNVVQVTVHDRHEQALHCRISQNDRTWEFTAVYASPSIMNRRDLWSCLSTISAGITGPWVVLGDFNTILDASEKKGGAPFNPIPAAHFQEALDNCGLMDLESSGPRFTWHGPVQIGYERVFERLDRAVCNVEWRTTFTDCSVRVLPRLKSDHHPLLLDTTGFRGSHQGRRPFRYMAAWHLHKDFPRFVRETWHNVTDLPGGLTYCREQLQIWNRNMFGSINRRKEKLMARLLGIQSKLQRGTNPFLSRLKAKLSAELEEVLSQEEIMWYQKSRSEWVKLGERNTKYFHAKAVQKRRRIRVEILRNDEGEWINDEAMLKCMTLRHFQRLYVASNDIRPTTLLNGFPAVLHDKLQHLDRAITPEEVYRALFDMDPFKAPGPDGFQAVFFQKNWSVISEAVIKFVRDVFENRRSIAEVNDTLLVLIPKIPQLETLHNFRPISLCNVAFKLVTKLIANRLQRYMSDLISPNQVSFVPGRHIQDNIVIAQELVHTMSRMRGKKLFMSIKIDLEKAYDRLSWDFIRDTLAIAGFPSNLRRVILQCITTASMQVLWNGELTESFNMGRGIRQGCPLSPYIFVLCIERLSHLISSAVGDGIWRPIRTGRHGSPISHLMFADDLLLFSEASMEQVQVIKNVLDAFCAASGQKEFYMGSLGRSKEASLGSWETLTRPVVEGGLGLRRLRQANDAFLAKLGWGLLTEKEAFWVRVLTQKYVGRVDEGLKLKISPQDSWLWKAIARAWNQVSEGATWAINRGDRARFWEDSWIPNCRPLLDLSRREVPADLRGRPVADFVDVSGSWNWNVFSDWLDHSSMLKWDGPQRIRSFLWLAGHDRLLTNEHRVKRNLASSSLCASCNIAVENTLHVLRDCSLSCAVWKQLILRSMWQSFSSVPLNNWLVQNLSIKVKNQKGISWAVVFGVGCWLMWSWRNKSIFDQTFSRPQDAHVSILRAAESFSVGWQDQVVVRRTVREWQLVGWNRPSRGWIKLNTDGASKGNPGPAGAGGVLRKEDGVWTASFARNVGIATAVVAELWGVLSGLELAWELGYRLVLLEVDSLLVTRLIAGSGPRAPQLRTIVREIRSWLERDWQVEVSHQYREGNSVADWMARWSLSLPLGLHIQHIPPPEVRALLAGDIIGAALPRLCSI